MNESEPAPLTLTPRLEAEIDTLAAVMANCPADLLWEALTAVQPPSTLPERWRD